MAKDISLWKKRRERLARNIRIRIDVRFQRVETPTRKSAMRRVNQDTYPEIYHQVLDSSFSRVAFLFVIGPGSRLMPMARAVLTARPTYMYDPGTR